MMRLLADKKIFLLFIGLVIVLTGLAIYFMQRVVEDTRQNLTALPQGFVTDIHNTLRQSNFALMKLDIHIKTAGEPPLDDVIGDLIRLQNRLFHLGATMERFGLDGEQQVFFRVEGGVLYALIGDLIAALKTGEPITGNHETRIRDMAVAIDDQATWLYSRASTAVHELRIQQGKFLTRMGYILSGMFALLAATAIFVAIILRLVFRQKNILDSLVRRDSLTLLGNRRAFDEYLDIVLAQSRRQNLPLAMMVLDVDHFKKFNDRYGHLRGDEALKAVGTTLGERMKRAEDRAFRIGGEEFACLYQCTDEAGAAKVAEEVLTAVRALGIPHADNQPMGMVTLSIGLFYMDRVGDITAGRMYQAADSALYAAKKQGRNCLRLYGQDNAGDNRVEAGKESFSPLPVGQV